MSVEDVLRNFTMFADGFGKMGNVPELELPKLALKMEGYRGGGMDTEADIDLGMEKLEASFTLTSFDQQIMALFGPGPGNDKAFTFRGSLAGESGLKKGILVNMRGILSEIDSGSWKVGDKAELKGKISLKYYKLIIDDDLIHEIDVMAGVRIMDGIDVLSDVRDHLGL